jgi:Icc-related predicted phosphoesterase
MKILTCSDIHLEFLTKNNEIDILDDIIPKQKDDKKTVLVIAGDFGLFKDGEQYVECANHLGKRFYHVILVAGNHEFYHYNDFPNIPIQILDHLANNVHFLDKATKVIDNVAFLGCSLFTDMNKGNPIDIQAIKYGMNDFNYIKRKNTTDGTLSPYSWKNDGVVISPSNYIIEFEKCKEFIFSECVKYDNPVVVTHFSPSWQTCDGKYRGQRTNAGYMSDLDLEIEASNIKYWICGHQHQTANFVIGETTIIQNAYGYYIYDPNPKFKPKRKITI